MLFIHITLWSLFLKYVLWACLYHDRHPQDTFAKLPASQWWIVRKVGRFQWERRRNLKWRLRLSRVADSAVLFRDRLVFSFGSLPEPLVRWLHHDAPSYLYQLWNWTHWLTVDAFLPCLLALQNFLLPLPFLCPAWVETFARFCWTFVKLVSTGKNFVAHQPALG